MPSSLTIIAILLACSSIALLVTGVAALRKRKVVGTAASLLSGVLLLSWAVLFTTITVAVRGYSALTHEEVAAVIETKPIGVGKFMARFHFADGRESVYELDGDELYVDAHILKWKPIANVFGLHTAYKLDRVAGRYNRLVDEQTRPRTVFALNLDDQPLDMFDLRSRYALFKPLLDAEYGSAAYITANKPQTFELRVTSSGLLIRKAGDGQDS